MKNLAFDDTRKRYYVTFYQNGKRKTRTFISYENALSFLGNPPLEVTSACTLSQWLHWWMTTEVEPLRAASTVYGYRNMIQRHMIPALGAIHLTELSPFHIQNYLMSLLKKGLSPNTVRKHDTLLRTALKRATALYVLKENPMNGVFSPQTKDPRYTCYTPQQLRVLFEAVQGSGLELPVKLAAYLGMRRSEITGLRWQYVDLQNQILSIQEIRTEVGGKEIIKSPKTRSSIRKLSFGGARDLAELLEKLYAQYTEASRTDYVVLNPDGSRPSPDDLTHSLHQLVQKHQLPPITLHGLRHSFASVANSQGATIVDISHALGHSSITVTSKIYVHMFQQAERHTMRLVAQALDSLPEPATTATSYNDKEAHSTAK